MESLQVKAQAANTLAPAHEALSREPSQALLDCVLINGHLKLPHLWSLVMQWHMAMELRGVKFKEEREYEQPVLENCL